MSALSESLAPVFSVLLLPFVPLESESMPKAMERFRASAADSPERTDSDPQKMRYCVGAEEVIELWLRDARVEKTASLKSSGVVEALELTSKSEPQPWVGRPGERRGCSAFSCRMLETRSDERSVDGLAQAEARALCTLASSLVLVRSSSSMSLAGGNRWE